MAENRVCPEYTDVWVPRLDAQAREKQAISGHSQSAGAEFLYLYKAEVYIYLGRVGTF